MKLGTRIETFAKPIARGIDAIWGSDLAGCSGCGKMRDNLNAGMSVHDAIIERWFKAKEKGEKMQFQIQIIIEAESVEEALQKKGEGTVISVNPRPQQPKPNQPGGVTMGKFSHTTTLPTPA